ncbi:TOTE conflict system archaeo-eukaryotic primase domain-containing protein [Teredinibacter turnerae]|uniref:TOTE conflict system archaeo-eukaryotic primase domain-containing protein n=1 Tax=Teredinibacter turnerae TaxID=2426 RepID=UPI0005A2F2E2
MLKHESFQSIAEIDSRLVALEQEKKQLLALREQLLKPPSNTSDSPLYSPEQKIAIFRGLFRGRTDIFANRWKNQQARSDYSVACSKWVNRICN